MRPIRPLLLSLLLLPVSLSAQLIGVRTVPIAAGDQFGFFPSSNAALGGVGIALPDPLGDPFSNPATGSRGGSRFFASPTAFGVSQRNGAVRSLPLGGLVVGDRWFAGVAAALQQVVAADQWGVCCFFATDNVRGDPTFGPDRSAANLYAHGLVGRRFGNTAIGVSASLADLSAVHGVELLYAGTVGIQQFGSAIDLRVGLASDLAGGRSIEATALHRRLSMTHDVTYFEAVLDTATGIWNPVTRVETNLDDTRTSGANLRYRFPVAVGWTVGFVATGNYKDHPKIPNYDLANIPRDPGTTWAWNAGVGVAGVDGPATFAAEVIYEPIRSHTWADAAQATTTASGGSIPVGGMTIENHFRFSNAVLRLGMGRAVGSATFQLGLEVRSINYRLRQRDHVAETQRRQNEDWMEWSPTWGAWVRFAEFELRYVGRLTTGTGRPSVGWTPGGFQRMAELASADFVVAPSGPLSLQDARVVTHQVAVVVPIR
jgi:hypothetical protein